jgi:hypothetical protein
LNLGDVDAVWAIRSAGFPGDNYMLFDNYRIVARSASPDPQPFPISLEVTAKVPGGPFVLKLTGEPSRSYAIDATADWLYWAPIKTNAASSDGTFDFVDNDAKTTPQRFYRARLIK